MKYMGSKARVDKYILPIILKDRVEGQYYVEPFVGGANIIDKVKGNRIGADNNKYQIALLQALQNGWIPPNHVTKEDYINHKNNKDKDYVMTAWCGFSISFGSKWFGGWVNKYGEGKRKADGTIPDRQLESKRSMVSQIPKLKGVRFIHSTYEKLDIPDNSIIYCDPPYEGTTGYNSTLNHTEFWEWCRYMSIRHKVYISEYNAPDDFICLWDKEVGVLLNCNDISATRTERLFTYRGEADD